MNYPKIITTFSFLLLLQAQGFAATKTCVELLGTLELRPLRATALDIKGISQIYSDISTSTPPGVVEDYNFAEGRSGSYLRNKNHQTSATDEAEPGELSAEEYRAYISANLNDERTISRANFLVGRVGADDLKYFLDKADDDDLESLIYNILATDQNIRSASQFGDRWLRSEFRQKSRAIKSLGRSGQIEFIKSVMAFLATRYPHGGSMTDIQISNSLETFHLNKFHLFSNYGVSVDEFRDLISSARVAGVDLNRSVSGRYSHIIQLYAQPLVEVTDRVEKVEILLNEGGVDPNVITNSGRPLEYLLEELKAGTESYSSLDDPDFLKYYREQLRIIRAILNSPKLNIHQKY